MTHRYADEEVPSGYTYPKEYKGPRPIKEQIEIIGDIFNLYSIHALENAKKLPRLPKGTEGWFAIPKWKAIAPTYNEATERMFRIIKYKRSFFNHRESRIGPRHLRQNSLTKKMLYKLREEQKGDILLIAAQLGFLHRGRSVRRTLKVMSANEFGLGAFAIGCILLTHPEREVRREQLHIDCAGDEYSHGTDIRFEYAPSFLYGNSVLRFNTYWTDGAYADFGTASAFYPENRPDEHPLLKHWHGFGFLPGKNIG